MKKYDPRRFNVYVIRLDKAVLRRKKFRDANPDHDPRKPCVYVGKTAWTPKERFCQHKRGYKRGKFVKEFGVALIPRQYAHYNPMTYEAGFSLETRHGIWLAQADIEWKDGANKPRTFGEVSLVRDDGAPGWFLRLLPGAEAGLVALH